MAGHVENKVIIDAPIELTWELANSTENDKRHADGGHDIEGEDAERNSRTMFVRTPPDAEGRVWEYHVERVMDAQNRVAYSRRWGKDFVYSIALWIYAAEEDGRSSIRCVQDFEMVEGAPADDADMERVLSAGTQRALEKTVEFIESEATARSAVSTVSGRAG